LEKIEKNVIKDGSISGCMTVGTDVSTTVAKITDKFNLPGIAYNDAICATNKYEMRKRFKKFNVSQPNFTFAKNLLQAKRNIKKIGFPLVIKPVDSMGARGVKKINNIVELEEYFDKSLSYSISNLVILEEYVPGNEFSVDALIYNGEIFIIGIGDRIIEQEPYFIETGHIMPSNKSKYILKKVKNEFKKAIKSLNIKTGFAKGDIKYYKNKAFIGEVAARLSGGFMSGFTFPYATGINLMKNAIDIALGYSPSNLQQKTNLVSVERAIIAKPGKIKNITGIRKAKSISGVKNIFLKYKKGEIVQKPENNVEKGGNIIVVGKDREKALKIADRVLKAIKIDIV